MKLLFKIVVIVAFVAFIVMQFFQPEKNLSLDTENLITKKEHLPPLVEKVFTNACLDCHSNNTTYLWYHKIAPVSWMVAKHVKEGKKELNLSEWGKMDKYDKIATIEDIRQEIEQNTMPIKPYTMMHKNAKLTKEDKAAMLAWIDKTGNELVKSSIEE